ncbi:serine hydrolase domain-containing protein [Daejeonella oryzae]|uniref:serine hydrolase domain-containing protein n=1 Tax=Daejeonella oryzae TaxID=1122943 RepID=UPI00138AB6C5|nr:serine hydrolase domain-containing protein [Daejeonella oryzae]
MNKLTLLFYVILVVSCKSQEINEINKLTQFEKQIDSLRIEYKIPGISVGISINDSIQLIKGFGVANVDQKIPVTGNTPFRIASLTKPIFSTIFMRLTEEGKINLNWKIKDYYPDYVGSCTRILGYFNEEMPEYSFLLNQYHPERDDIFLKHHLSHTAENIPGTAYKYNGFLYGMLSDVVETATHQKFDKWVDSLVIKKLNLQNSASSQLDESKRIVLDKIALPYKIDDNGNFEMVEFPDPELNAGAGLVFSANDLLLFDKAFDNNTIISKESKEKVLTPFELKDKSLSPYGYGWFIQKYNGYTLVWHYGLQPNAYSGLYLKVLEKDLTLVILANSQNLSEPFDLGKGNVLNSKFAMAFLNEFLNEKK